MRFVIVVTLWAISLHLCAQDFDQEPPGFFVVVGVFRIQNNAQNFSKALREYPLDTEIFFNSENNYFYVHAGRFDRKRDALGLLNEVRSKPEFSDAWIKQLGEPTVSSGSTDGDEFGNVAQENNPLDDYYNEEIVQYDHIDLDNTEVFLSLFNAANNRVIEGKVHVIDTDRAKSIRDVNGNDYLKLPNPNSQTGTITLIAEVPGYRKVQREVNYRDPLSDPENTFVELMGTSIFINFEMIPFGRGEIQTLYNVYFFNDASVMRPESRSELKGLLGMLQDYPSTRIRLHGHTNGNYHGKIIEPASEQSLFSLTNAKQTSGSANDLAYKRARTIKDWLVSEGIEENRIEIKSWGGKKPLYDKHSANAKKNVRVEVEKLAD